jgi:hypothetical protein
MSYRLHFSEAAKKDVLDIYDWYESLKSGLGNRFRKELTSTSSLLRKDPLIIQFKYADMCIVFLKVFPYGIHFTVVDNEVQ